MKNFRKYLSIFLLAILAVVIVACGNGNNNDDDVLNETLEKIFVGITPPTLTGEDINLPRQYEADGKTVTINWLSNNRATIHPNGTVYLPDVDTEVVLTALVLLDGVTHSREFRVTVTGVDTHVFPIEFYESDYGFAHFSISNRATGDHVTKVVENEVEFLEAMREKYNAPASTSYIIEITKDLNMGARYVREQLVKAGYEENEINSLYDGKIFRENANHPMLHPILIENGVGQLIIQVQNLMIYSKTGITIKHLTNHIKDAGNIVIRNIHYTGIWEWDEVSRGDYDANDWDYFTIERTKGVWLDHLELNAAYDGLVDIKQDTEHITISYLFVNGKADEFIEAQFTELERIYQETPALVPHYAGIRNSGASKELMIRASGTVKKGFNFGNTTGGINFEMLTITIHHSYFLNLQDRIPRLRRGDVHMYNVVIDSQEVRELRSALSETSHHLISQALVPTEQGSVFMENSRMIGVNEPIKTHQENVRDPDYTGKYFVKNSIFELGNDYFYGSTGDFLSKWEQSNNNVPRQNPNDFYFTNHQHIPYKYDQTMVEAVEVRKALLDNGVGSGEIEGLDWLRVRNILTYINPNELPLEHKINGDLIELEETLVDMRNPNFVAASPLVRNYYPGANFVRDKDYTLTVDQSLLDVTKPGEYQVKYTFQSLVNENDVVVKYQTVVVYDGEGPNEIFFLDVSDEFNATVDFTFRAYRPLGTLYYYFSDDANLEQDDLLELATQIPITASSNTLTELATGRHKYLYLMTEKEDEDGLEYSTIIRETLVNERVIEITTRQQFESMLTSPFSKNNYYVLMNDIDLTDSRLRLTTQNIFSGVFDGNGFTLSNYGSKDFARTRGGLFHTINGGMIKNVVLDNFHILVGSYTELVEDETGNQIEIEHTPNADAGILATYIYVWGRIDDVVIKNSKLDTNQNYGAAVLGRVRSGVGYFNNISLIDVEIYNREDTEYSAGFIGSGEPNTRVYMNNLYADGLSVEHSGNASNMIGGIAARLRSFVYVENVVFYNSTLKGPHNLGIGFGKEDKGAYDEAYIKNAFMNVEVISMLRDNGEQSPMFGYAVGNYDHGAFYIDNYHATYTEGVQTGYPRVTTSEPRVGEPFDPLAEDFLETVTEAWWSTNLPQLYNSEYWVMDGNLLKPNHPAILNN